jgi:glycine/D-amino acid oxidase-like deaminating enzyme
MDEVPGGTVDPGKLVSGLARAAQSLGAIISQCAPVSDVAFGAPMRLAIPKGRLCARQTLFATNAEILELSGLAGHAQPKFALAVATAPLELSQLEAVGLGKRKPFYTVDLPYLWGRAMSNNAVVWGSGLLHLKDWREFESIDVGSGEAVRLFAELEQRVRGLHRELRSVEFTHRWGGPILFARAWRPTFAQHPRSPNAFVLGAYSGHGVALSVYLECWAAEVLLGRKTLPPWGAIRA